MGIYEARQLNLRVRGARHSPNKCINWRERFWLMHTRQIRPRTHRSRCHRTDNKWQWCVRSLARSLHVLVCCSTEYWYASEWVRVWVSDAAAPQKQLMQQYIIYTSRLHHFSHFSCFKQKKTFRKTVYWFLLFWLKKKKLQKLSGGDWIKIKPEGSVKNAKPIKYYRNKMSFW